MLAAWVNPVKMPFKNKMLTASVPVGCQEHTCMGVVRFLSFLEKGQGVGDYITVRFDV
jgi:hypothetical protein